ncbi:MAG: helix-hairpin-helix domain-containing protein [Candidatus Hodarchaeales archaeon]|jgi:uncharacterized protein
MSSSSQIPTVNIMQMIAADLHISLEQVKMTLDLLNNGNTVPFIARYRKEKTGSLDELQIRSVDDKYKSEIHLIREKTRIKKIIQAQRQLTASLETSIEKAATITELNEIYSPFKKKRKTKGLIAREKGLELLASAIMDDDILPSGKSLKLYVEEFVESSSEIDSVEEALEGARHIIAEDLANSSDLKGQLRDKYFTKVLFRTQKSLLYEMDEEEGEEKDKLLLGKKYEQYFDFQESALSVPPHRLLAMLRGDREGILSFKVIFPDDLITDFLMENYTSSDSLSEDRKIQIEKALLDSWKRLLGPSLQREIKRWQLEKAGKHSIQVFSENLKHLLLTPPIRSKIVGIDPAYRTGCKYAAIDELGNVLATGTIYPTKPHEQFEKAAQTLKNLINKHSIPLIAIGNGTASRETEEFVSNYIAKGTDLHYVIVNEAGASVYSASDLAREEFPKIDVSIRGAISIARRLQDPLSELVKIDPRSIGVGQYQHDLTGLSKALKEVVIDTVNLIGVDVNTASEALLKYVSGISKSIAKSVIQYRLENGAFVYREDLKNVSGVGNRTYEQCAGFLRISGAPDPFDNSPIHPESYEIAERIIDFTEYSKEDLNTVEKRKQLQKQVKMLNPQYAAKKLGLEDKIETITDIISILQNPYRDPREDFDKPILKSSVLNIEDLEEGSIVEGTITNVTDFGCFVDLGVKTNGLIHISEISESFIRHPREAGLKIGDIVKPKIKEIDLIKKRISLTLKKSSPKRIKKNLFKDRSRSKSTKTIKKKKPETFEDKQISSLFKNGKIQL